MTGLARALTHLLCLLTGWLVCLWWHGLLVDSGAASADAQATGEQFITADRAIGNATDSLGEARERVRTVIREVPTYVPIDCPPGAGLVSVALADRLRAAAAKAASATAEPAPQVRPPGD